MGGPGSCGPVLVGSESQWLASVDVVYGGGWRWEVDRVTRTSGSMPFVPASIVGTIMFLTAASSKEAKKKKKSVSIFLLIIKWIDNYFGVY